VDLAVHSLKDVETAMPTGLVLTAILEREDPGDALVARPGLRLDSLPHGARVGTSSLRRAAFLRRWRPDLDVADLRGNVPTRLRRLDDGDYDAIILAAAGLKRLGLGNRITDAVPFDVMLPAVSQGAIAIQLRADDERVARWIEPLDHAPTRIRTTAERALLREVEGGCQVPLGAHATIHGDRMELAAAVASLDGAASVTGRLSGTPRDAVMLGRGLAGDLLARGGEAILAAIRAEQGVGGSPG
jgi:hydroxymethylbilane synthase